MTTSFTSLLAAALLGGVLGACNDKLDLTAPYKENTIIYALLDKDSTIQYVKINKAFLGDGNAYIYAQVPDSTEYTDAQLSAVVKAVKNGAVVASYPLRDTLLPHDPGIFAGPAHKLYYFTTTLDSSAIYRLEVTAKGNSVSSQTAIVARIQPQEPTYSQPLRFIASGGGYNTQTLRWNSAANGKRYDVSYRFNWAEVANGDTVEKNFVQYLGTVVSNGLGGGEAMTLDMSGEAFYRTVSLKIPNDPAVTQRIFQGLDLIWGSAGADLHTYLELNSPISSIVEDRPSYTNVTNGYGLFSTRRFRELHKTLDANSIPELVQGQYTAALLFCVPGSSPPFGCN